MKREAEVIKSAVPSMFTVAPIGRTNLFGRKVNDLSWKGAGTFHSASQSKEGSVGFGTSQHPIFMKLLPDHLWH